MEQRASIRVQSLAESGIQAVPHEYVRAQEPSLTDPEFQIPVIDLQRLRIGNLNETAISAISSAANEWGFFQILNHGIDADLISRLQDVGREFFGLPLEEKEIYKNNEESGNPVGYGSRVGYSPDAKLDWGDYYYNVILPTSQRDLTKWPRRPSRFTEVMEEYAAEIEKVSSRIMKALSTGLGLENENAIADAVGGERKEIHMRINYYPPCPQPDLVVGVSPHSDPVALTILLHDNTPGLQIKKDDAWINVQCVAGALIVNIGDSLEILSNGKYKSLDHRSVVQKDTWRMSWATFCTPPRDAIISPLKELINQQNRALYGASTYGEYLQGVFNQGLSRKGHLDQLRQYHQA